MDDYIDGKEPTIKLVILQDFANELGNVINAYKKFEVPEVASETVEWKKFKKMNNFSFFWNNKNRHKI